MSEPMVLGVVLGASVAAVLTLVVVALLVALRRRRAARARAQEWRADSGMVASLPGPMEFAVPGGVVVVEANLSADQVAEFLTAWPSAGPARVRPAMPSGAALARRRRAVRRASW